MNFELTIRGDSFEEIASIFSRNPSVAFVGRDEPDTQDRDTTVAEYNRASGENYNPGRPELRAKEIEPEIEAPAKPARTRRAKVEKVEVEGDSTAPEKVTFEDIRALASSLMDSGKVEARAIQDMLVAKFDARAFGALKEEQYADCLAELQNL